MGEEYQLPDVFTKLPVDETDEFDRWEHTRDGYRVYIKRYYDSDTSFWWVGKLSEEVPPDYSKEWTEETNLEKASASAWHALRIFLDLDRTFGPTKD